MSMIQAGYMAANVRNMANRYRKDVRYTEQSSFSDVVENKKECVSVVDEYKKKNPEDASHVEGQVAAGRAVREKCGAGNRKTDDMSMEEYQNYFNRLLDSIPYDASRIYDDTILSISDAGWEQMKKDPDYEAWILGYFVEDRAVRNPFFGIGGNCGSMIVEQFGASIEEHRGVGYSKSAVHGKKAKDSDEEDSWWIERHKRMKKLIKEQGQRAREKSNWVRETAQEEFEMQQLESRMRMQQFLEGGVWTGEQYVSAGRPFPMAAMTYDRILSSFSRSVVGNK